MNRVPENESCKQGKDETSTRQFITFIQVCPIINALVHKERL